MPQRPDDPLNGTDFQNSVLARLRALERNILPLPEDADPLQTFESGTPLGNTRFLSFGDNLHATLIGDDYVLVNGSGGGPGGWDAIVDGTNGASDPENRVFLGIGEALTYLRNDLGITERAMVLVRSHPTNNTNSDMPTGQTYVETAHVTAPNFPVLVSTQWFQGGHSPGVGSTFPRWDHDGYDMTAGVWTVFGMTITGKEHNATAENKTALFQGAAMLQNCWIEPNLMSTTGSRYLVSATTAILDRCVMFNGWMAFTEAYNCEFRIYTPGTYNPGIGAGGSSKFIMYDCGMCTETLFSGAVTWDLAATENFIRMYEPTITGQGGCGSGVIPVLRMSAASGRYRIENSMGVRWAITNTAAIEQAYLRGYFNTVTIGAPAVGSKHALNSVDCSTLDLTGPAQVSVATNATVTLRGTGVAGTIMSGRASSPAIAYVNADQTAILLASSPIGGSGTGAPYTFDASSANNVLVIAGRSLWSAGGTDAGTNNRVLPEGSAPPAGGIAPANADYLVGTANAELSGEIVVGTTPGGELGGTWAAPTVDLTHSGSAHADFIANAFMAAKGDLISASADNTPIILTVGTNNFVLVADSTTASGLKWVDVTTLLNPTAGWGSITNVTPDRAYDANATSLDEIADTLGTLVADLISQGILDA